MRSTPRSRRRSCASASGRSRSIRSGIRRRPSRPSWRRKSSPTPRWCARPGSRRNDRAAAHSDRAGYGSACARGGTPPRGRIKCLIVAGMPAQVLSYPHHPLRNVRLDTLMRLRWLAVFGQTAAVLVVYDGLDFELPLWPCLAVIGLYAWLNIALRLRFRGNQRLEPDRAAWLLAFDIAELAGLLFLTGGLQNPFAFLFLGPVLISATALPARMTLMLGGFTVACATVLVFVHEPLPSDTEPPLELPATYVMGVWLSLLLAIAFIGLHAWQITEESRQLADALAATELVLAREQHLSQHDGRAAAAAHEPPISRMPSSA